MGKDFDECLGKFGGKVIVECLDCDVDYEVEVEVWLGKFIDLLKDDFSVVL